jgi:hypothetical protein
MPDALQTDEFYARQAARLRRTWHRVIGATFALLVLTWLLSGVGIISGRFAIAVVLGWTILVMLLTILGFKCARCRSPLPIDRRGFPVECDVCHLPLR